MNSSGIGLGLTIVKQIVETAEGTVAGESAGVGQGSQFSFSMMMEKQELMHSEHDDDQENPPLP